MVSGTISLSSSECFSPFLHSTRSLSVSGLTGVFSLTGWSRLIHAEFLVLRATQDTAMPCFTSYTGLSPSMVVLSRTFYSQNTYNIAVLLPRRCRNNDGLGCSPVARHYWGNHYLFSLPRGTKMFQFPRFASLPKVEIYILQMYGLSRLFAPTRSLSQLITSFIASVSLGIRHTPFLTFFFTGSFHLVLSK